MLQMRVSTLEPFLTSLSVISNGSHSQAYRLKNHQRVNLNHRTLLPVEYDIRATIAQSSLTIITP